MKKNKSESEKSGVFLKVLLSFVLIVIAALGGYFAGSKGLFSENCSIEGDDASKKVQSADAYSFDLKNIECQKEENSCSKELKVSYNNSDHVAKVVISVTGEDKNSTKYTLYLDDKEVYTVDNSNLGLLPGEDITPYLNVEGFIYIFDKTNIAFVLPNWDYKMSYVAYVFNSDNSYMRDVPITGLGFVKDDKDYTNIDAVEFDGHTLKVWDRDCNDDSKGIQYAITIENGSLAFKQLQTVSDVMSGGLAGCKYKNEKIS